MIDSFDYFDKLSTGSLRTGFCGLRRGLAERIDDANEMFTMDDVGNRSSVNLNGAVMERYEYDAYGEPNIMDADYNPRASSLYGNL